MPLGTAAFLIVAAFLTALLSGIFGMAGGLILMGALALVLPVSAAFVTHGVLQLVANGWRAILHRQHISWPILLNYAIASAAAGGAVALIAFTPSLSLLFLLLGLVPLLVWLPRHWLQLDAARTPHALISGFLVTGLNLTAGVAGPLLDIFSDPSSDRCYQGRNAGFQPSGENPCLWRTPVARQEYSRVSAAMGFRSGNSGIDDGNGHGRLGAGPH